MVRPQTPPIVHIRTKLTSFKKQALAMKAMYPNIPVASDGKRYGKRMKSFQPAKHLYLSTGLASAPPTMGPSRGDTFTNDDEIEYTLARLELSEISPSMMRAMLYCFQTRGVQLVDSHVQAEGGKKSRLCSLQAHPIQPEKHPAIALEAIIHQTFQEKPYNTALVLIPNKQMTMTGLLPIFSDSEVQKKSRKMHSASEKEPSTRPARESISVTYHSKVLLRCPAWYRRPYLHRNRFRPLRCQH